MLGLRPVGPLAWVHPAVSRRPRHTLPCCPPPQVVARGGSRQLRSSCPPLLRDLLAVLCGLRPAFMLDYGQLPAEQLAAAAAGLAATLRLQAAAAQCCVLVLGDCCYVVRPEALPSLGDTPVEASGSAATAWPAQRQLAASDCDPWAGQAHSGQQRQEQWPPAPPVLFVAFDGPRPRWASAGEAAAAVAALQALRSGLFSALHQRCPAGSSSAPAAATCPPLPVVQAEDVPGWQQVVPPTASGYLLGYPAVYLCGSLEGAQAASRGLSSGGLCLHVVAGALFALPPQVPQLHDQPLLGFSVPTELAASPEWATCRDAWWAALERRASGAAAASGGLVRWERPQLSIAPQPPRPVAL